jgi:drug/metabolite transporter (DMT)-like permease
MNVWLLARGETIPLRGGMWLRFLLLGFLNNALPFVLLAWGEITITSGMASILNATTPIFMVMAAHWGTHDEKLSVGKVIGIVFGIVGVMVLVGPDAFAGASLVWGELAVIAASCVLGFAGVYSRGFTELKPMVAATGQVTGATVILAPLSLLIDRPWDLAPPSGAAWASLLTIALVNTALAYFFYYRMLAITGVTYISLVTFLIPVMALLLGAVFLHEVITMRALAGMVIIALGLLAMDARLFKQLSMRSSPRSG